MKVQILKQVVNFFCILLVFSILSCQAAVPKQDDKVNILNIQNSIADTTKTYTLGNCVFTGKQAINDFLAQKMQAQYLSFVGLCHDCLQYHDYFVSIHKQSYKRYDRIVYSIEVMDKNIAVKINIMPKVIVLDMPYDEYENSVKNRSVYHSNGIVIANRNRFLAALERTGIFNITPKSGTCVGIGCVQVQIKKYNEVKIFDGILGNDTAFLNAVKKVEVLIEKEMAEAGIIF